MYFLFSAGWPACMCVIVRSLCGLGYTHTECPSMGWKPAKQAAFERACFVSLSAGWSHSLLMWKRTTGPACWGRQDQPIEEHRSLTLTPQRDVKAYFLNFLSSAKNSIKRGRWWGKLCLQQMWACTVVSTQNFDKRLIWGQTWCII